MEEQELTKEEQIKLNSLLTPNWSHLGITRYELAVEALEDGESVRDILNKFG